MRHAPGRFNAKSARAMHEMRVKMAAATNRDTTALYRVQMR
jgi:hypothetical protein